MPIQDSTADVRGDLLRHSMEFMPELSTLRAREIFIPQEVPRISGKWLNIPREAGTRVVDAKRARGSGIPTDEWEYGSNTYATERFAHKEVWTDEDIEEMGEYGFLEQEFSNMCLWRVRLWEEQEAANNTFENASLPLTGSTGLSVTHEWDDPTNAVPIDDVEVGINAIYDQTGVKPDTLVLNWRTIRDVMGTDQIRDRFKYVGAMYDLNRPDLSTLASALHVQRILEVGAPANDAGKGLDADMQDIWDREYGFLCITRAGTDFRSPRFGNTFYYNRLGGLEQILTKDYNPETEGHAVICRQRREQNVRELKAGFRFGNLYTA